MAASYGPRSRRPLPAGDWRQRLAWLLLASATAAGHGGLARVALTSVPGGPNATAIAGRVRNLLVEAGIGEDTIPAALDLLGLFVTAAALDRVPDTHGTPEQHQRRLRWEVDVILTGLTAAGRPGA